MKVVEVVEVEEVELLEEVDVVVGDVARVDAVPTALIPHRSYAAPVAGVSATSLASAGPPTLEYGDQTREHPSSAQTLYPTPEASGRKNHVFDWVDDVTLMSGAELGTVSEDTYMPAYSQFSMLYAFATPVGWNIHCCEMSWTSTPRLASPPEVPFSNCMISPSWKGEDILYCMPGIEKFRAIFGW